MSFKNFEAFQRALLLLPQASVADLTGQNTGLDARLAEAEAAARRAELDKLRLAQINENLTRNTAWLEENLGHLGDALKSERQKGSSQASSYSLPGDLHLDTNGSSAL